MCELHVKEIIHYKVHLHERKSRFSSLAATVSYNWTKSDNLAEFFVVNP